MSSESAPASPHRVPALVLGGASLLTLFAMAHHPTGVTHAQTLEAMERGAALAAWVHGVLIALMALVLWALLSLVEVLGWRSRRARAGLLAYGLGVLWMSGAAIVSGFVAPRLTLAYASEGGVEILAPTLRFGWETNQALAQAGTMALSAAILFWSWALLSHGRWGRALGVAGLAIGAGVPVALLGGWLHLDVHGMGAVLFVQAAWTIAIAVWLFRGAPGQAGQSQAKTAPVVSA